MKESTLLEKILRIGRKIIPKKIFKAAQPIYHYILAITGAMIYRFPGKKLIVVGVTGTKGKTTTVELVNAILEAAGYKTALASTLRYKIGEKEWRNMFKMTLRGRFFTQSFLRQAVSEGCTHAIIEVSSEGVPQSRHKFLFLDALIFTNLAPEHIESHGSYEKYVRAKIEIAKELEGEGQKKSPAKKVWPSEARRPPPTLRACRAGEDFLSRSFSSDPIIIVNADDKEAEKFLALNIKNKIPYSLRDTMAVKTDEKGSSFQIGKIVIHSKLPGIFNVSNMLAAISYGKFAGISDEKIKKGLEGINFVRGRMEKIFAQNKEAQGFDVVVDYAHTTDSLKAVYETYNSHKKICVLGNTGGGRDKWKREEMGKIASKYCDQIILTNEDPYDEDPMKIIADIKKGIKPSFAKATAGEGKPRLEIIMGRREAIRNAIEKARDIKQTYGDKYKVAVLITGKGTDPYIMEAGGKKTPWDDATVAKEELSKILDVRH